MCVSSHAQCALLFCSMFHHPCDSRQCERMCEIQEHGACCNRGPAVPRLFLSLTPSLNPPSHQEQIGCSRKERDPKGQLSRRTASTRGYSVSSPQAVATHRHFYVQVVDPHVDPALQDDWDDHDWKHGTMYEFVWYLAPPGSMRTRRAPLWFGVGRLTAEWVSLGEDREAALVTEHLRLPRAVPWFCCVRVALRVPERKCDRGVANSARTPSAARH